MKKRTAKQKGGNSIKGDNEDTINSTITQVCKKLEQSGEDGLFIRVHKDGLITSHIGTKKANLFLENRPNLAEELRKFCVRRSGTTVKHPVQNDALANAYEHVMKTGQTVRATAKLFNVPHSTLNAKVNHNSKLDCKMGRPTYFSEEEESQLAQYIVKMESLGYGFSRWQIKELAANMSKVSGKNICPTKHWFYAFVKRFPEVPIAPVKKKGSAFSGSSSTFALARYFTEYDKILLEHNLKDRPGQIWSFDEVVIVLDQSSPKIVSGRSSEPCLLKDANEKASVIVVGNAQGQNIAPYVVYKGELKPNLTEEGVQNTVYTSSSAGLCNSELFLDFIRTHFTRLATVKPCILLYDGHSTHITPEVINVAKECGVHLFAQPPRLCQQQHSVDLGIFGPFQKALCSNIQDLCSTRNGEPVEKSDLPRIIETAFDRSMTLQNLTRSFCENSLYPFEMNALVSDSSVLESTDTESRLNSENKGKHLLLKDMLLSETDPGKKAQRQKRVKSKGDEAEHPETENFNTLIKQCMKQLTTALSKQTNKRKQVSDASLKPNKRSRSASTIANHGKTRKPRKKTKMRAVVTKHVSAELIEESEEPGPSNCNVGDWITYYNPDSDEEANETEPCCICRKFSPPNLAQQTSIGILSWAKCSFCDGWVHLKHCSNVQTVADGEEFKCPNCE